MDAHGALPRLLVDTYGSVGCEASTRRQGGSRRHRRVLIRWDCSPRERPEPCKRPSWAIGHLWCTVMS